MDSNLQWNRGCPVINLTNHQTNRSIQVQGPSSQHYQDCRHQVCTSTVMNFSVYSQNDSNKSSQNVPNYDLTELKEQATKFLTLYYKDKLKSTHQVLRERLEAAKEEIENTGSIHYNYHELKYGCQLSWRNAARCINRLYWQTLEVIDNRHFKSNKEMFEAICENIRTAFNKGNLKASVLVLPERSRVWTSQFLRFACYEQDDGSLLGDPANQELTKVAMKLGWSRPISDRTQWDLLPLIVQWDPSAEADWFELPKDCKPIVHIEHPDVIYDKAFKDLGLRWVAQPFVADKAIEIGGILHTGVPFSGWFMGTEIGRDLCDVQRYNFIPKIADFLGLDINNAASSQLNIDRIYVEVNAAVLYSFQKAKITIVDHHNAAAGFMKFMRQEANDRGNTPADWIWLVPPISSGMNVLFHQEMLNYVEKPCILDQEVPWTNYKFKESDLTDTKPTQNTSKGNVRKRWSAVKSLTKFVGAYVRIHKTRTLVHVLYASTTGTAQSYAEQLTSRLLKEGYQSKLRELDDFDIQQQLVGEHEDPFIVLVVTSTFGEGNAPTNGLETEYWMISQRNLSEKSIPLSQTAFGSASANSQKQKRLIFSVCAIGSTAYTNYCQFGSSLDHILARVGGTRLAPLAKCDALDDQYKSYSLWEETTIAALKASFPCVKRGNPMGKLQSIESNGNSRTESQQSIQNCEELEVSSIDSGFIETKRDKKNRDLIVATSKQRKRVVKYNKQMPFLATVIRNEELVKSSDSEEYSVRMIIFASGGMKYIPGDHLFVFPENPQEIVNSLILRCGLQFNDPDLDRKRSPSSSEQTLTLRETMTQKVDLVRPLRQNTLELLVDYASSDVDKKGLLHISQDLKSYSDWMKEMPTVIDALDQFPSVNIPLEELLQILPPIQPRPYSISSSRIEDPTTVQITVRVHNYETLNGVKRFGLCSNFLKNTVPEFSNKQAKRRSNGNMRKPSQVRVFINPNPGFYLPGDIKLASPGIETKDPKPWHLKLNSNLAIFSVGSGIAAFRSFWREISQLKRKPTIPEISDAKRLLFFGCRTPGHFLYAQELCQMQRWPATKIFTEIIPVFSRLENESGKREYVQDRMLQYSRQIYTMLTDDNSYIYISGSTKACLAIEKSLALVLQSIHYVEISIQEASDRISKMKREGRIRLEMFG